MKRRTLRIVIAWMLLLVMLSACSSSATPTASVSEQTLSSTASPSTTVGVPTSVAEASAENSQSHATAEDYPWDEATAVPIILGGDSITATGDGVSVVGSTATISAAGSYLLSGSLSDGQIIVETEERATVQLILNGVDLRSSTGAPISILKAEKVALILADGTQNYVSDAATYVYASADEDEPNAAIFSRANLSIGGSGALTVTGNYNDGIASKDGLVIADGTISVSAADDGIRGKDYLLIQGGSLTVTAQGDGLTSDNPEDADKGYINVTAGVVNISAGGDAIQAATDVLIAGGEFTLSAGGGSGASLAADASAKGIKGNVEVVIDGGSFSINSADDAVHSNGSIAVHGGSFSIASGDDGIHADAKLQISGGDLRISESYEGIEGAVIVIDAGTLSIVSSDDGINVAGGNDGQAPGGGGPGGWRGQDSFAASGDYYLSINGGYIVVDAAGDGIDVGGPITMSAGTVVVNGPTENMNGALDCDGAFSVSGGLLVAAGSSGMAQAPDTSSSQYVVLINSDSVMQADTLVHIESSTGAEILTFAPSKQYQSIVVTSPDLANGATYTLSYGGSATGSAQDGLYPSGAYSPGAQQTSFTITEIVTRIGNSGGGPFR